jgi:hypothetical protein
MLCKSVIRSTSQPEQDRIGVIFREIDTRHEHRRCDEPSGEGEGGFRRGTGSREWRVWRDDCVAVVDLERAF